MKSKNLILSAMLIALPSTLMAQQNIQKAFDALLKDKIVETKTQHTLERDPETERKTAQADVYDFTLASAQARKHIKNIQEAFEKDKDAAYTYRTGTQNNNEDVLMYGGNKKMKESFRTVLNYSRVEIAVGDGKQSVAIGGKDGANYVYACFTDKDDATKKYRYCYAMDWVEKDSKTIMRLAITYALKPEASHSNGKRRIKSITINGEPLKIDEIMESVGDQLENIKGFNNRLEFNLDSIDVPKSSYIWLSEFNTYKKFFLKNPDGNTATHHATSIYNLCKNADGLEADEKKLVISEIKKLKEVTGDDFIQNLFDMCIERLKK
ncbi:hypothetical protein SAMN05216462_2119 [Xylanibacter ruminicola]|uniref:DUF4468 domain-containing protein n=1 Tax=Xylanibacter ruminicola TaxID=839 RepID=A0A1H4D4D5_XYLRU|nr:hypothetical protein [Xylanibacter ruminicola]SEA67487.1 hypothetical protein SAMN05216462_2119 [Xylanibacter ruminicola]